MRNAGDRLKFIKPVEPELVLEPPVSDDWFHEIKYDGFRTELIRDWAGVRAFTKNGHDWSKRYWPVVTAAEQLKADSFILDGEMIAPEPDGRPNFHAMHSRMTWNAELLAYVAFDILWLNDEDLRQRPAIERKEILWDLIKPAKGIIQYSAHVLGGGAEFYEAVEKMGLEGIVSKRQGSSYRSGPSDIWVKTKCWEYGEFDLLGIKREPGKETVGLMARDGKYAGPATIALTKAQRERLMARVRKGQPPAGVPTAVVGPMVEWVGPGMTARVRYLRGEAKLRHASVQDLRDDGT
ncbi:RNA ligase family protein [Mesorhizobium sp. M7A.F.Ca.MR.245.00.0.0]|uniref:ATP-dependent DNA ligase n=1 Tax=Mesorhizobium sp. M7A.F.Ca.MR.245.00.0.0 TaxID=2496778 RepID=UPI000FCAE7C6|nr:RNA ligase family protein [Mesorhizobium sp. M7A.F.Ca.MR.245.00.0.0]RUV19982.1 DNA ligase [Mesorhizobium sp. M7A.F.Ca.MR.245.00.0.0]RUV53766.1 DNA ligase [Mesorhizobium sp. M7A.F.Ca.MR.228.00.0.0]